VVEKLDFLITDERGAAFIKGAVIARRRQSELVKQNETQNLTWDIIYQVAGSFFQNKQICVTDVCHAVMASKSSTIKALDRLVRDGVLVRTNDKNDKRRKFLNLNKAFEPKFLAYLDEFIFNITIDE
jgi:DNA-binding MarR family transcriptional regulator|tara:strand:- start:5579 stop:5959 length:381 start_codon:yes stop_codon:yes gene_type:complete